MDFLLIGSKPHINCKNMKLPNDICRCHDAACDTRYSCLRWLCRGTGSPQTPHCQSHCNEDGICYAIIDKDKPTIRDNYSVFMD